MKSHPLCLQAGLDSLGAVELRNAVVAEFSINVPPTLAFDYPSISALAAFIAASVEPQAASPVQKSRAEMATAGRDIAAIMAGIVSRVLGTTVSADQPLMEVSDD